MLVVFHPICEWSVIQRGLYVFADLSPYCCARWLHFASMQHDCFVVSLLSFRGLYISPVDKKIHFIPSSYHLFLDWEHLRKEVWKRRYILYMCTIIIIITRTVQYPQISVKCRTFADTSHRYFKICLPLQCMDSSKIYISSIKMNCTVKPRIHTGFKWNQHHFPTNIYRTSETWVVLIEQPLSEKVMANNTGTMYSIRENLAIFILLIQIIYVYAPDCNIWLQLRTSYEVACSIGI